MNDLSDTKESSGGHRIKEVHHFVELIDITAFLAVMNKNLTLAFRGQPQDHSLLPTLFRSHWCPPIGDGSHRVRIDGDQREHYWEKLKSVEQATLAVLHDEGLPRWRHLRDHPPARWAVIQHYELWPTPLLDFSTSLRVAASFAFDCHRNASGGYLYVVGLRRIHSDLMPLSDNDDAEQEAQLLAIRLNAVCPPKAKRPHLQEGVLLGHYPFRRPDKFSQRLNDASSILIAKLRLINQGDFWSKDFPIHRRASLLPKKKDDGLLRKLRERVNYRQNSSGRITPGARA
ncbi:FRG domain-containing protein [Streptosporangium roseum]|uniref:FRG domain-containing protein n=1 Tax=Streptosporangium roseum TaxID=2001 RepID=UPI003332C3F9